MNTTAAIPPRPSTTISKFGIIRRVAGVLTAVLGLSVLATPAADAATIGYGGYLGYYTVPHTVVCQSMSAWNQLKLIVPAPSVYARNDTVGWGNDSQPVRYRLRIIDLVTGQRLETAYSRIVTAFDNVSPFGGVTPLYVPASGPAGIGNASYRVEYQIEWLRWGDNQVVGWVVDHVARYNYINMNGSQGVFDRCIRVA